MNIIEEFTHGKHRDQSLNEDGYFIGGGFVAVVDGVTSKASERIWMPTPGVVAKDTLLAALEQIVQSQPSPYAWPNAQLTSNAPAAMRAMQQRLDAALHDRYEASPLSPDFFRQHPTERLQANMVVYSEAQHEIWLFGDCLAMVNGKRIPTMKKVDLLLAELRSFVFQAQDAAKASGVGVGVADAVPLSAVTSTAVFADPGRDAIMPFLKMQANFANQRGEYGYFVFDGFTDPEYPVHAVPVHPGDEVVLASDGYPILCPTLDDSETELLRLRQKDPLLIREFKDTKSFSPTMESFDDRTYVRFVV
ncbi:hypothetical protein CS006_02645 [Bifidobacterium primatium]|uniref:Uncharacterized protein n=1 Tax=Bifidobacterium primatium TaxID=2045438 RepID=A0A2M9HB75_9BIFI|nr:hypothetical protein [Bifidobacterium primatium]PJM74060.1 hypothetical protein CS006_02645 [Bifidobacterium primatium]